MKTVLLLIALFLIPFSSFAHPGKTDHRGGHKCWKNCNEWELGRGEYHLHDDDWNPVHIDRKENVVEKEQVKGVPTPEKRFLLEEHNRTVPGPVTGVQENRESNISEQRAVATKNQTPGVYEESFPLFNAILLLVLALLLLIVLIYVRKKREKE